jgi:hypothetical protein
LPSSAPVGSFHPTRFCPCWAHWGRIHIGSSDGDCAPSPSHTTGHAVFRIRRLNAAVYRAARSDGIRN